ncbi:hypothetical protein AAC691_17385 [Nguyenibacter vanlangensis]|uniref:Uncharacterized protein n=1 Tax=Nguyenibacter vanlangensis TaxID=1216886 RepID=A0ABZ3D307_9PROT
MRDNPELATVIMNILSDRPTNIDAILNSGPIDCELYMRAGRPHVRRLTVGKLDLLSPATMLLSVLGDAKLEVLMPAPALRATRAALMETGRRQGQLLALASMLSMIPTSDDSATSGSTIILDEKEYTI